MRVRTLAMLAIAIALLSQGSCQRAGGGGGPAAHAPQGSVPAANQPGYSAQNPPPINAQGTPTPPERGGRVIRQEGGPNGGSYGNPPPEDYHGSGSDVNPPQPSVLKRSKVGTSPAPKLPSASR